MSACSRVLFACSSFVLFTILVALCHSSFGQEAGTGGDDPPPESSLRFPFEHYDYFRIETDSEGEISLVPIERHSLGLYTPAEHFQQALNLGSAAWSAMAGNYWTAWGQMGDAGQWLSAFAATLGSQGSGVVMVKKQDENQSNGGGGPEPPSGGSPTDQVIVVVSGFGPWEDYDPNNSTPVAGVVHDKLKDAGIATEKVIIDVIWGEPDRKVDEVVTDISTKHPNQKIVWIALGIGGDAFQLETVGRNPQGPFPDAAGTIPAPGSQNEPGGPPTSGPSYDPESILTTLNSHGVEITASTDAGSFLCDAITFKLHRMDEEGKIECGIFIHIPQVTDDNINDKFADGLIDVIKNLAEQLTGGEGNGGTGGNQGGTGMPNGG